MFARLIKLPTDKSFFLFGPRGTGKTTWVKQSFSNAVYLDFLEAEIFNDLLANPQRLESFIPKGHTDWIIIDEVQRIPEILNEVHRLIEARGYRFILTGSSARKLRRSQTNLLAGRALTLSFHPLTTVELKEAFQLEHSLQYGHLPSAYTESDPKAYLESYVKTYLEEEIRQEGLTRELSAFSRFLESASFSQGALLNISNVARDCAVKRKVVENYFSILEDLLIGYRIPVFERHAQRRVTAHPKFYFYDVGVYRTLRPKGPLDLPEEAEGAAFETLVFQELLATNAIINLGYKLYYWRTANGLEVDFILYGNRGLIAIEVKRAGKANSSMLTGLRTFLQDYPAAKGFFVYGGDRKMQEGSIEVVPIHTFLKNIPTILNDHLK